MQNMVPLGTGNSRFMKSNIPASTTLQQLIQMLNNGTFPYDVGAVNPAGVSQQGTPLNKATLLQDATAALFGLTTDAVPDDVFEILSQAALYKTNASLIPVNTSNLTVGQVVKFMYAGTPKEYRVLHIGNPNTGIYDASCDGVWLCEINADASSYGRWSSTTIANWTDNLIMERLNETVSQKLDAGIQGVVKNIVLPYAKTYNNVYTLSNGQTCKFFALSAAEYGFVSGFSNPIPGDGSKLSYFLSGSDSEANALRASDDAIWTRTPIDSGIAITVTSNGTGLSVSVSDDRSLHCAFILPLNTMLYQDTTGVLYANQVFVNGLYDVSDNLLLKLPSVQIETGSYVGTGTYGSSNPNSLTFGFEPKFFICISSRGKPCLSSQSDGTMWVYGFTYGGNYNTPTFSLSGNTLRWYSDTVGPQLNKEGETYFYAAIG